MAERFVQVVREGNVFTLPPLRAETRVSKHKAGLLIAGLTAVFFVAFLAKDAVNAIVKHDRST